MKMYNFHVYLSESSWQCELENHAYNGLYLNISDGEVWQCLLQ